MFINQRKKIVFMESKTVSDKIIETLIELGINRVYGLPADNINPLLNSISKYEDKIRFIKFLREDDAGIAAVFEAKYAGKPSVCFASVGPSSALMVHAMYEAKMDHVPTILITVDIPSYMDGKDYVKALNLLTLFKDVANFNVKITNPLSAKYAIYRAYKESILKNSVSHISFPLDLLKEEITYDEKIELNIPRIEYNFDTSRVIELINKSEKPLILIGHGARKEGNRIAELAEKIGSPIIYTMRGKGIVSDYDEKVMGGIGAFGTDASFNALSEADLLIILGSDFPHTWYFRDDIDIIQVDTNPNNIGKRLNVTEGILSDVRTFIDKIMNKIEEKKEKFYSELKEIKLEWEKKLVETANLSKSPIKPQKLMIELSKRIGDQIIVSDIGSVTVWVIRDLKVRTGQLVLTSAWYGTMGCGIPGGIGVALASNKEVLSIVGDGGFNMNALELIIAKKLNIPLKVIVFNNKKYSMIKFEQEMEGFKEYETNLDNPDYSTLVTSMGIKGISVNSSEELGQALDEFLSYTGLAVLDINVDGDENPFFNITSKVKI